ncbi:MULTISPECIES: sialate O-acetylesterase [Sphingobacterium]|uniref:Sialate O-acetylesterase n=1 Tax=Sphingobacterium populi TaxID=1812824 RepID=A0ABW5UH90_9SPHI|nr:sialate O-acetylesterase [Sphingobacterium sp. CFCC 11742]
MICSPIKHKLGLLFAGIIGICTAQAQDPNFHIYLCFGQSNMEGHGKFEAQDTVTNARVFSLQAVDCPDLERAQGKWYLAQSPITRCHTGLTPADYFGKTLAQNSSDEVRIGIINVAVGGCRIELFDRDSTTTYVKTAPDWMKSALSAYGNDPYEHMISLAKIAQESGVIKGILLHQGESNTGDLHWPRKVKRIYDNIINDLHLSSSETPLLAGELLTEEFGGKCASMNAIIQTLPTVLPEAIVVSSAQCEGTTDGLHFSPAGYRQLGTQYAKALMHHRARFEKQN